MTELEKIAYAKSFIDQLANGINPLDGQPIPTDEIVNNVRLSRCFFYVSDLLRQVIENGGIHPAPPVKEERISKRPYYLTPEQIERFEYSSSPIPAAEIFTRIIAIGPREDVKKFPRGNLTKWLLAVGILEEVTLPNGSKAKRPTAVGRDLGLSWEERNGQYGTYYVTLYNYEAQRFILDNMDAILELGKNEATDGAPVGNQGCPWLAEHDLLLTEMFHDGATVAEMSKALKRNGGGIRARLVRLGLIQNRRDAR